MGHLQRLSNWNVRRAITRHRTAQVLDAISYYNRARDQSNQPEVYDGILSHLASLAEISELTEGVSMLNVSENSEEQLRQLHHAFRSLRTECSLIDGDVPVHVPLLAALVSAPTSINPAAAEAEPPADRPIGQGAVGALPQFPQLEGPPGAPREVVAAPQLPQHRAAPTPAAPTPAAAEPPAAPTPAAPTPEAIARDQGVTVAQAHIDGWRARAVALSRAGSDGPARVRVEARLAARDGARGAYAGPTPGAVDAFVEGFVSTVHAAASQAVAEHIASWVSQAVNNDRDNLVNGVRRQGLDRVLALAEPRGRELLVYNGIMEGPYFQNALASYVAHMRTIASAASADLERRAATGPTADLELEGQDG